MIHNLKFNLGCSQSLHGSQPIELRYSFTKEGKPVFAPFNGCDSLNGPNACNTCLERMNSFLLRGDITLDEVRDRFL